MNSKLQLHQEENLIEILNLLVEVLENVIEASPIKKEVLGKKTIGFEKIKIQKPFNNLTKNKILELIEKVHDITKDVYEIDKINWSSEEITSFKMMSDLIENNKTI